MAATSQPSGHLRHAVVAVFPSMPTQQGNGDSSDEGFAVGDESGSLEDLTISTSSRSSGSPRNNFNGSSSTQPRKDAKTNLIVNYLPQGMDLEQFRNLFETRGELESIKLVKDRTTNQSLGYGFVNFVNEAGSQKALTELNGLRIQNKTIKVSLARPSCETIKGANLYVSGMPKRWVVHDLEAFFAPYGVIITARILSDNVSGLSKGVGFVRFDQKFEADRAIARVNGQIPDGHTEPIQVKYANNPSAAATAVQAAAAAAAAASAPSVGGRMNFGASPYGSVSGGFIPALAAFMQNGGLNQGGLGLGLPGLGLMASQGHQMASQPIASTSNHRSRISPVGPIHHQTPRLRYSPMGSGDVMSASGLLNAGSLLNVGNLGVGGYGAGNSGPQTGWTVFVYNLPSETEETALWQLFGPFGGVHNVKIVRDQLTGKCKGYAFITMTSYDEAVFAIQNLNGYVLGNRVLQVSFKTSGRK